MRKTRERVTVGKDLPAQTRHFPPMLTQIRVAKVAREHAIFGFIDEIGVRRDGLVEAPGKVPEQVGKGGGRVADRGAPGQLPSQRSDGRDGMAAAGEKAEPIGVHLKNAKLVGIVGKRVAQNSAGPISHQLQVNVGIVGQQEFPALGAEPPAVLDPVTGAAVVEIEVQPDGVRRRIQRVHMVNLDGEGTILRAQLKAADQSPIVAQFRAHLEWSQVLEVPAIVSRRVIGIEANPADRGTLNPAFRFAF